MPGRFGRIRGTFGPKTEHYFDGRRGRKAAILSTIFYGAERSNIAAAAGAA